MDRRHLGPPLAREPRGPTHGNGRVIRPIVAHQHQIHCGINPFYNIETGYACGVTTARPESAPDSSCRYASSASSIAKRSMSGRI